MTNDTVDPLMRRAEQIEAEGGKIGGEETWKGVVEALGRKMVAGELSQAELQQRLARPNAAAEIFNSSIGDVDEATWRAWRSDPNHNPKYAERLARVRR
jgi:hypothetical protein